MTKQQGASVKIGGTKRPNHFVREKESKNPGPGNYAEAYATFGKNVKGVASMGSKYKPVISTTPGPGQYQDETPYSVRGKSNVKIGTTRRPDLWEKESRKDLPGPGNY